MDALNNFNGEKGLNEIYANLENLSLYKQKNVE